MKAFIIHLKDIPTSCNHALGMVDTLTEYGHKPALFDGIPGTLAVENAKNDNRVPYPYGIKTEHLSDNEIKEFIRPELWDDFKNNHSYSVHRRVKYNDEYLNKISSPGVIGCFYSHYTLWARCVKLDEPIMIFEDDVKFFRNMPDLDWDDVMVLALGKSVYKEDPYKKYMEDPEDPPRLIEWRGTAMPGCVGYAIKPHAARALVKTYRNYFLPADNAINQHICKIQMPTHIMGRTTLPDEGNISAIRTKNGFPW